jgi:hypothetical protein
MTQSVVTCPAELFTHLGLAFKAGDTLGCLAWLSCWYTWVFYCFDSPGWASGTLGVLFLSGPGLVTHSELLGIGKFVDKLMALLEFVTCCNNRFLVGRPHTTGFSTGSRYIL